MRFNSLLVPAAAVLLASAGFDAFVPPAAAQASAADRGKYLTEAVGMCQECHTPKLETGDYDRAKWLKGSTLNFAPINPIKDWHKTAPDITPAGSQFKRWKEDGMIHFLETGRNPRGGVAGPPMPQYRFSHEDAVSIVEYLKTLQ